MSSAFTTVGSAISEGIRAGDRVTKFEAPLLGDGKTDKDPFFLMAQQRLSHLVDILAVADKGMQDFKVRTLGSSPQLVREDAQATNASVGYIPIIEMLLSRAEQLAIKVTNDIDTLHVIG